MTQMCGYIQKQLELEKTRKKFERFWEELYRQQVDLDPVAKRVLYENRWELYE